MWTLGAKPTVEEIYQDVRRLQSHQSLPHLMGLANVCLTYRLLVTSSRYLPAILAVIKQAMVAATRDLIAILAMSPRRLGAIGPRPPRSTPRPRKFVKPHKA